MKSYLEYLIESLKLMRYCARLYNRSNHNKELYTYLVALKFKILLLETLIKTNSTLKAYAERAGLLEAYLTAFIQEDAKLNHREYEKIALIAKWNEIKPINIVGSIRFTFKKELEKYLAYYQQHHPPNSTTNLIFIKPLNTAVG